MNSSTWIAIYMPVFIVIFVVLPSQQEVRKAILLKKKKGMGEVIMTNEMIEKCLKKKCKITAVGSLGTTIVGKIVDIKGNWLEVETKKGVELINVIIFKV